MKRVSTNTGQSSVLSIRLTAEERDLLTSTAGELPLSTYVRQKLFSDSLIITGTETRLSVVERQKLLSKLLMKIGTLNLDMQLSKLSSLLETGVFENEEVLQQELEKLSSAVAELRIDLLRALGLRPNGGSP